MKTKRILIGTLVLSIFAFIVLTQIQSSKKSDKIAITNFEFKAENKEELKKLNWGAIKEMFKENDSEQEISLAIILSKKAESDDILKYEFTGKTKDFDILTERIKNQLKNLN
jgi:hypothetical protein